jgi:uncharacterized protein (DUF697 family)/predicted GTPase
MLDKVRQWFSARKDAQIQQRLDLLRERTPVPVFWLFGKTQSGKTSLIKHLTGADDAEIGHGFKPCTRYSRQYQFPTTDAPLLTFLDTRGMDEPGYDAAEDLAQFNDLAHVVVVTVKALDHSQERTLEHLRRIRKSKPGRPVVLVLTSLHEAYPQQQHPEPYPFGTSAAEALPIEEPQGDSKGALDPLLRCLREQQERFHGLVDRIVPVDLTRPEEGFANSAYGGEQLKRVLLEVLPSAYRHTLLSVDELTRQLQDLYARQALPRILGYSTLAATAGAIPVLDLLILPGIQSRMIYHLARFYGQPLSGTRFLEVASTLGLGILLRQASREVAKLIPYAGSVAGGVMAGASTFALGKAFCYYYSAIHQGHVPKPEDLRRYYQEQLTLAEGTWKSLHTNVEGRMTKDERRSKDE